MEILRSKALLLLVVIGLSVPMVNFASDVTGTAVVARPTYKQARMNLVDEIERSVSPASRVPIGTVRIMELDVQYNFDIKTAAALDALAHTLRFHATTGKKVDISEKSIESSNVIKKFLFEKGLAQASDLPFSTEAQHHLSAETFRSLLSYWEPKEFVVVDEAARAARLAVGIARWEESRLTYAGSSKGASRAMRPRVRRK